jgi:hypothetical protein
MAGVGRMFIGIKTFKKARATTEINAEHVIFDFSEAYIEPIKSPGRGHSGDYHWIIVFARQ